MVILLSGQANGTSTATCEGLWLGEWLPNYIEVDPISCLNIHPVFGWRVSIKDMPRNEDVYLYKDFGVDAITDFYIEYETWWKNTTEDGAIGGNICLTNVVDDLYYMGVNSIRTYFERQGTTRIYTLKAPVRKYWEDGPLYDTLYYMTLYRIGSAITLDIYDDPAKITPVKTIMGRKDTPFRYLFVTASWNSATPQLFDGFVQNVQYTKIAGLAGVSNGIATVRLISGSIQFRWHELGYIETTYPKAKGRMVVNRPK